LESVTASAAGPSPPTRCRDPAAGMRPSACGLRSAGRAVPGIGPG